MINRGIYTILLVCLVNFVIAQDWTPLFNGENLDDWTHVGEGKFEIENGVLKTIGGMGLLYFDK